MPTFRTPMPPRPRITHIQPSWLGDRPAAIRAVAKKPAARRFIDCNFQAARSTRGYWVPINLHWGTARKNNYRYITARSGTRKMSRAELNRPLSGWSAEGVVRWRRTRSSKSERPHTYYEMAAYAHRHGVTICAELKHAAFAQRGLANTMVRHARAANHPAWFMALLRLPYAAQKCSEIKAAGGSYAQIFGTYSADRRRWPTVRKAWSTQPTRTW